MTHKRPPSKICSSCGSSIERPHLARHRESKACAGRTKVRFVLEPVAKAMQAKEYVRIEHPAFASLITRAGVPSELAPASAYFASDNRSTDPIFHDGTWVPIWANLIVEAGGRAFETEKNTKRPPTHKRVAVLKACLDDPRLRNKMEAILLMLPRGKQHAEAVEKVYSTLQKQAGACSTDSD